MSRGLLMGAILCAVSAPALAGGREEVLTPQLTVSISVITAGSELAYRPALLRAIEPAITLRAAPELPKRIAEFEVLTVPRTAMLGALVSERPDLVSRFTVSELRPLSDWWIMDELGPVTASANGSYAVHEAIVALRQRRPHRPAALKGMLALKIEGEESPAVSVGSAATPANN